MDVKSLPRIHLDVTGVGGAMKDTWYKFRVNLTSATTGQSHFEQVYLAEECGDKLLSYETLKHLGHIDEDTFLKKAKPNKPCGQGRGKLCEESTVYCKDKLEYLCNCPRRTPSITSEEREKKKIVWR